MVSIHHRAWYIGNPWEILGCWRKAVGAANVQKNKYVWLFSYKAIRYTWTLTKTLGHTARTLGAVQSRSEGTGQRQLEGVPLMRSLDHEMTLNKQ